MSEPRTKSERLADATALLIASLDDLRHAVFVQEQVQAEWDTVTKPLADKLSVASITVTRAREQVDVAIRRLQGSV